MARPALPMLLLLLAVAAAAAATVAHASAEDAGEGEVGLGRRLLQVAGDGTDANGTAGYISYGALYADRVPCTFQGASYYNCRPGAEANPYERGCSAITMCRD
ncbi:protein RALF-like 33 [Hordeum vulgare subsp. vulgare]|uniref:protein RALF-like 33 n=1 Tax=Hordeum vulgare subsp. vulgare TaxID=112509 RepID=UPI001D1A480B|nr:protein RALF-like 33 [Hordeum vulgare subsp. vulgare]